MNDYGLSEEELAKVHGLLSGMGISEEQHERWMDELSNLVEMAFDSLYDEYGNERP